jgi:hypothetical protein
MQANKENEMDISPSFKQNISKFIVDIVIFIGFLLALDPRVTGNTIHEWLTIAGTVIIVLHLLLNWNWIGGLTKNFFRKATFKSRFNYILNWLFFIDGILVMLTGIMISEVVLPAFGLQAQHGGIWRQLHSLTADIALYILALHLALNWDWVANVLKRYIFYPIAHLRTKKATLPISKEVQ